MNPRRSRKRPPAAARLLGPEPTGFGLGGRRLSPFVGRDLELRFLLERLDRARQGLGQIVWITGEPGIGKSRLLFEFRQHVHALAVPCLQARCASHGAQVPYHLLGDLLRRAWDLPEESSEVLPALRRRLDALGVGDPDSAMVLASLLDADAPLPPGVTPRAVRHQAFVLLREVLLAMGRSSGSVLLLEDLHWIDQGSAEFLEGLFDHLAASRIFLALSARAGHGVGGVDRSFVSRLALPPLNRDDSTTVARAVLPAMPPMAAPSDLVSRLVERAGGNPFFLEELLRAVDVDQAESVPETVTAALMARMDRLDAPGRRVLEAAAVLGREVPGPVLSAMLADDLPEALQALVRLEFLHIQPGPTYLFKHALTQEVAYGRLMREQRRRLHLAAGQAFERLAPEGLDGPRHAEYLAILAQHAFGAEAWPKAAALYRQAGTEAFCRAALREAVACFERARDAIGRLGDSREALEQAVDVRLELRGAFNELGEIERVPPVLRETLPLAERLGDPRRIASVLARTGNNLWLLGDIDQALEVGHRAKRIADSLDDLAVHAVVNHQLGQAHMTHGDAGRAMEFFRANVVALAGPLSTERFGMGGFPAVLSRTFLSLCLTDAGEFAEASQVAHEAVTIAEACKDVYGLVGAIHAVGQAWLSQGERDRAAAPLTRSLELCRTHDFRIWLPNCTSALGSLWIMNGRLDEALALHEEAVAEARRRHRANEASAIAHLAIAYRAAGRHTDALTFACSAIDMARRQQLRHLPRALLAVGDVAADPHVNDSARAESSYHEALAVAERLGYRPIAAHARLGLSALYRRLGRRDLATEHLRDATELYREMGMHSWVTRAEMEMQADAAPLMPR